MKKTTKVLAVIMAALMLALSCAVVLAVGCNRTKDSGHETNLGDPTDKPTEVVSAPELSDVVLSQEPTNGVTPKPAGNGQNDGKKCYDIHYTTSFWEYDGCSILETEDTVYYLFENYLYFSDKDYKDFMPLCSRPNCSHTDKDCDAYVYAKNGIWIYDDHIYFVDPMNDEDESAAVSQPVLCRLRLDGTQHEEVMTLPMPDYGYRPIRNSWVSYFTNKYLLVKNTAYENEMIRGGDADWRRYIIDLDTLEVKYVFSSEDENAPGFIGAPIAGDGTKIYSMMGSTRYPNARRKDIVVFDLETLEGRLIGTSEPDLYSVDCGFMLLDDAFEYFCWDSYTGRKSLWRMDLETGENTLIAEGDNSVMKGTYMEWTYKHVIDLFIRGDESDQGLYVLDADLNEVGRMMYDGVTEEIKDLRIFLQTDSYIFAAPNPRDENGKQLGLDDSFAIPTWYLNKAELSTGNLAWHRWAPDGD